MQSQKYNVNQFQISNFLNMVEMGQIEIPEIQRPFVWETTRIRDLLDSIYNGYPIGYIIAWKNPTVRLRNGSLSNGKTILIDGQQRITALRASLLGQQIVDKNYKKFKVRIAFNPLTEKFETLTPAIEKDRTWIPDISVIMNSATNLFELIDKYCNDNSDVDKQLIQQNIQKLLDVKNKQLGYIELDETLDIETVTEIFIRINSKGVVLSSADFAMSKVAAHGDFGVNLRKFIDYFCHLAKEPKFYEDIKANDEEFIRYKDYFSQIEWLKNETEDLYDPSYIDILRTVTIKEFERGRVADLVSLLSGRDFETRQFKQSIVDKSYKKLEKGVYDFTNQTHFNRFMMIIKSAGYINRNLITSQNALNFAYAVYLKMREMEEPNAVIEKVVKRWFVMSMLTSRHSGSFESQFETDIRSIKKHGGAKYLKDIEEGTLTDAYWSVRLPQELDKYGARNPFINTYFTSQIKANDKGFLSKDITVKTLIENRGDIHHIFPKDLLIKRGYDKYAYNRAANFVITQSEINITISNKEPSKYMAEIQQQIKNSTGKYGLIVDEQTLKKNLKQNCIPTDIFNYKVTDFDEFLEARRKLMAAKIKKYYQSL
jgi:hypothetical protein